MHALDYLLKPVSADRCARALARARKPRYAERRAAANPRLLTMLSESAGRRTLTRLPVRTSGRVVIVELADVDWIQAADNYILHAGGHEHLLRETLGRLEKELDPDRFVRIHRSAIVQVDRIRELRPAFHGDFIVVLRDRTRLTLSRGYRAEGFRSRQSDAHFERYPTGRMGEGAGAHRLSRRRLHFVSSDVSLAPPICGSVAVILTTLRVSCATQRVSRRAPLPPTTAAPSTR